MSNFINRIRKAMHPKYRRGCPSGKVLLDEKDLTELLHHFENSDSVLRRMDGVKRGESPRHIMQLAMEELWHATGQQADDVTHVFAITMARLLSEQELHIP